MKTKKRLLPFVAMAVLASFGLTACKEDPKPVNNDTQTEQPGETDVEEEEIVVTAAENKKDLLVGETVQLTASVEGVRWSSRSDAVAKVSDNGVVTAMGAGSVKIQAKKDGYKTGSITINVTKAPEKEAKYTIGLEDADHFSPTEIWGMDLSAYGMGFMGPGDSPIENNNGATEDSTSLGYLQAGCKETLTFTSDKAAEVEIGVTMAYAQQMDLNGVLKVTFNGVEISMEGKVCEGPEEEGSSNYYDFHAVSFGKVNLKVGNNVLEIEMIQQGPNMDSFKIFTEETLAIAVVKPAAKPAIVVTPTEIEVEVDQTATITTETAGVAYESSDATVATVTDAGVVTGLKVGKATITVTKEGMKKATVAVTVKAKPVAGQVILEAEDAVLPEGTAIQVENGDTASGGKSLGYISAEQSFELKYTAEEAKIYKLSIVFSSATLKSDWSGFDDMEVSDTILSVKLNGDDITLGTITVPGGTGWTKVWTEFDLGDVTLKQGENVFTFAATAQAPNIDCIKLTDPNASQGGGTTTPVEKRTVSFDANGGTGTMAAVEVEVGEYTLPNGTFTAPEGKKFAGWYVNNGWFDEEKKVGDKINVTADITIKARWMNTNASISFDANGGTGTMDAVSTPVGEYTLPANGFTAPTNCTFGGWEVTVQVNQWQSSRSIKAAGDKIDVTGDMTIKAVWNYAKDEQLDLTSAVFYEAEAATLANGAQAEDNAAARGGKSVGYMSNGATVDFTVTASASGKATMILLCANVGTWSWTGTTYDSNTAIDGCMTIKVNNTDVSVAGKGLNMSEQGNWVQVNFGEIDLQEGENHIVLTAAKQTVNVDALALISTLTLA